MTPGLLRREWSHSGEIPPSGASRITLESLYASRALLPLEHDDGGARIACGGPKPHPGWTQRRVARTRLKEGVASPGPRAETREGR